MISHHTSRRRLLSLAILTSVGAGLPGVSFATNEPAWITTLTNQLRELSLRMHTTRGADGKLEFLCEMRDPAAWGQSFVRLAAAEKTKVRARGNVLTFSRGGQAVQVTMSQVSA